jgi:hypothetical protein
MLNWEIYSVVKGWLHFRFFMFQFEPNFSDVLKLPWTLFTFTRQKQTCSGDVLYVIVNINNEFIKLYLRLEKLERMYNEEPMHVDHCDANTVLIAANKIHSTFYLFFLIFRKHTFGPDFVGHCGLIALPFPTN